MAEAKKTVKKTTTTVKAAPKAAPKTESAKGSSVKETAKVEKTVTAPKKQTGLTVDVVDATGKVVESISLPAELFGGKVNKTLLAQAVRVYLLNQRQGTVDSKTRGEVDGSTRKIYRQKGTGRARHGGIRAPIFVKGGVAHGPKQRDYDATMPKAMKRAALVAALTAKLQAGEITVVAGFEKIEAKTKKMADALAKVNANGKTLLVMPAHLENTFKAARNIDGVTVTAANMVNTYELLNNKTVVLMKDAVEAMKNTFVKEK